MQRLRVRSLLVGLLVAATVGLLSCGDGGGDDDAGEAETTTTTLADDLDPGDTVLEEGPTELDVETVEQELNEYAAENYPDASLDETLGVQQAGPDDTVTIGPTEDVELAPDVALDLCGAATSVIYQTLPTADVQIVDADGQPLAESDGPGGSCVSS